MGPASGSAKFAPLSKEKRFSPGDFEKHLHETMSLTGMDSQKHGRDAFFFCLSSYTGFPKGRVILLRSASEQAKTKLSPVWPCVRFWEPGRG